MNTTVTASIKHLFLILLISSCESEILVNFKDALASREETIISNFNFSTPTRYSASEKHSFSYALNKTNDSAPFNEENVTISSDGTASCSALDFSDEETDTPTVHVSECSGDGKIYLNYGNSRSYEVYIKNDYSYLTHQIQGFALSKLQNDRVYFVDSYLDALFKLNIQTGKTEIVSDSTKGVGDSFNQPKQLVLNSTETIAYVTDVTLRAVLAVDLSTGDREIISEFGEVGSGQSLNSPTSIEISPSETILYVIDSILDRIMSVDIDSGNRTEIAGNSVGSGDSFQNPKGLFITQDADRIYTLSDDKIYEVEVESGNRNIIASTDVGEGPEMSNCSAIAKENDENILIYCSLDSISKIMRVNLNTGARTLVVDESYQGPSLDTISSLNKAPNKENQIIMLDSSENELLVANTQKNMTTIAFTTSHGKGGAFRYLGNSFGISSDGSDIYVTEISGEAEVFSIDVLTGDKDLISYSPPIISGSFSFETAEPEGLILSSDETHVYVSDDLLNAIVKIDIATGTRTTIANHNTLLNWPVGITMDSNNDFIYVSEWNNRLITKLDLSDNSLSTLSNSSNGIGTNFSRPSRLVIDPTDTFLYVNDTGHNSLFRVEITSGDRNILSGSGNGTGTNFSNITSSAYDKTRNLIYVSDTDLDVIFAVDETTGDRSILSGGLIGSGPALNSISAMTYSTFCDCLYVSNSTFYGSNLLKVDLNNGDRTLISN